MTENIKIEKWSSLRLDFQQFIAQDYCSACVYLECVGSVSGYTHIRTNQSFNKGDYIGDLDHTGEHKVERYQQETAPLSIATHSGYLWQRVKNNGQGDGNVSSLIYYYEYEGDYHIASSSNPWKSDNYS